MSHKTLLLCLLLAIGRDASAQPCPGDLNGDRQVTVDEILTVVNTALSGCSAEPTPTATGPALPTVTPSRTPTASRTATRTRTATPSERFVDNGDGTVTDTRNDLMWEKKSDDGSAHDKDLLFSWSASGSAQANGTVFTSFLAALNSQRFAGHRDWRLPTRSELESIVDRNAPAGRPKVVEVFDDRCRAGCDVEECSCSAPLNHWTATTNAANNQQAWYVLFNSGDSGVGFKTLQFHVRAVRSVD